MEQSLHISDCLNPCSNGRYSQRTKFIYVSLFSVGLNPCSNGRYSQSKMRMLNISELKVLILVLMEDTLRVS